MPRALIVEDDPTLARVLAMLLKGMGFDTQTINEGTHAVETVRQTQPDLVLLDLMLPGRSGFEICQELKLDRETNLIPIIISTALSQHDSHVHGLRVGANYYLVKPFDMAQLQQAVDHVMAWRRSVEASGAMGEIRFQINSDLQYLEELNRLLSSLLHHSGLTDEQAFELATAVREMGNNAIEWGNRKQVDQPVTVTYRIDPEKVEIVIKDEGSGFNREDLDHAACPDDPTKHMEVRESKGLRCGGFGIFMTRGLVDDLQYNETGNEVTLVKRVKKPAAV